MGSSTTPNDLDYKKVRLYYDCVKIDCLWSTWSNWTLCSKKCGGGVHAKFRQVLTSAQHGGSPCQESAMQTKSCNEHDCISNEKCEETEILSNDSCCHFPFKYEGVTYNQCTKAKSARLWCATQVDADGEYIGEWERCDDNCKKSDCISNEEAEEIECKWHE